MKKNYFLTILIALFYSTISFGQTTLSAGDIVIIEMQGDGTDGFRFVPLVDLAAGTKIRFTDNGWMGSAFRANEGIVEYTAPAGGVAKGTNIRYSVGGTTNFLKDGNDINIASSGDQILAYQGTDASPTFIFAVSGSSTVWHTGTNDSNQTDIPTGLTDGVNAITLGSGSGPEDEFDNIYYSGITTGTASEILAAVANASNWTGNNSSSSPITTGFTINTTSQPSLSISSPSEGSTIDYVATATVKFTVSNFNVAAGGAGDGYIKWKLDDVAQADKTDTNDITFAVTGGTTYKVYIELVDNAGNPLSSPVNKTVNFTVNHPCDLTLGAMTATCDAITSGVDTFSGSIAFTGGNTGATYTITAPAGVVVGGDNPNTSATGTITFSGMTEGTNATVKIVGGASSSCDYEKTFKSPTCVPFPIVETFNYTADTDLIAAANWSDHSTSSSSPNNIQVKTAALTSYYTASEFPEPTGNMVSLVGGGSDPFVAFNETNSGVIYASFLFQVTNMDNFKTNTSGDYFAILAEPGGTFRTRLYVKDDTAGGTNEGLTYQVGIGNGSTTTYHTAFTANIAEPVFVVMAYDFGSSEVKLWVTPDATTFEAGSAPAANITLAGGATSLSKFILRQDKTSDTPSIDFDELRIGTTWAQVTPKGATASVGKNTIEGFAAYPNPVTNGKIQITTTNTNEKEVSIYSILGKRVFAQKFSASTKELDVSHINAGIYVMKVIEGEKIATKKLVIK